MPRLFNTLSISCILLISVFLIVIPSAFADGSVKRLSEPVAVTATHEVYGAMLPEQGAPLDLAELINGGDRYLDQEVLVATRIAKVCQKKGCFFIASEGPTMARISFKDYGFFIPTDAGGKEVLLLGIFSRTIVTEKEAEHFASDLGETTPTSPEQFQYSIVASVVQIPKI